MGARKIDDLGDKVLAKRRLVRSDVKDEVFWVDSYSLLEVDIVFHLILG